MPVYIEKSEVLVGCWCYHNGKNEQTNKQGKVELLSQWTPDGWDEQKKHLITNDNQERYASAKAVDL